MKSGNFLNSGYSVFRNYPPRSPTLGKSFGRIGSLLAVHPAYPNFGLLAGMINIKIPCIINKEFKLGETGMFPKNNEQDSHAIAAYLVPIPMPLFNSRSDYNRATNLPAFPQ